jgi:hypothetical protein
MTIERFLLAVWLVISVCWVAFTVPKLEFPGAVFDSYLIVAAVALLAPPIVLLVDRI